MVHIDLNCDLGESFGAYSIGKDSEMMPYITSANIACGFHAGDPSIMKKTVKLAIAHEVKIGAHPGFPDLQGFGRRSMTLSAEEVYGLILYQIGALEAFVRVEGGRLNHVKPHGALYNMAASDKTIASSIAKAIYLYNKDLVLYGLSGSKLIKAGDEIGLKTASEVFADRRYNDNGSLVSRSLPDALIHEPEEAIQQVLQFIKEKTVTTVQGNTISIKADTVCLHGDGPNAFTFAQHLCDVFKKEGISLV